MGWGGWFGAGGGKKPHKKRGVVASFQAILERFFGVLWVIFALLVAAAGKRTGFSFLVFKAPGAAGRRTVQDATKIP